MRRWLQSLPPTAVDSMLAVGLGILAVYDWSFSHDPLWRLPLQLLIAVTVIGRRRFPLVAIGVLLVAAVALRVSPGPEGSLAFIINAYSVGRYAGNRWGSLALLMLLTAIGASLRADGTLVLIGLTAWLAGDVLRERARNAAAAVEAAGRGAAEERYRIARELHDIIAHGVAVMVVQAEGARNLLDRDPSRARAAIDTIAATGREAMRELRQLLDVLGTDGSAPVLHPVPADSDIDGLVGRVKAAGHPVVLCVEGDSTVASAAVRLALFRVVQEGLTNAVKYAPGASTEVHIVFGRDVEVEVVDAGGGGANLPSGGGRGLTGLGERIRLLGGQLSAGATPGGGYALRATIPLQP